MPIDIQREELIRLGDAPKHVPGRPHISTLYRWMERGVKGVKLECVAVGGRTFVSKEGIARFITACSGAGQVSQPSRIREKQIVAAERELTEAGIL